MKSRRFLALTAVLPLAAGLVCAETSSPVEVPAEITTRPGDEILTRTVRSHAQFLSDDLLEGRGTGHRGHEIAALYVAAQFFRLGLSPAGEEGGYFQKMTLLEAAHDLAKGQFSYDPRTSSPALNLSAPSDVLVTVAPGQTEATLAAPAVYIGYGVRATEFGHDDLSGVDLSGKIAVVLSSAPPWLPAEPRAHYASSKLEVLAKTGAVAVVTLSTPRDESRRPWAFSINSARLPSMRLIEKDGSLYLGFPELKVRANVNLTAARQWVASVGQNYDDWVRAAEDKQVVAFAFPGTLTLSAAATVRKVESRNVLGRIEGTDPLLADSPLVVTAHLDHLGIGPAIHGDSIYNGTLDNALGTSTLLTVAERLVQSGHQGKRPLVFALVTAEEKGLLGSYWLSRHLPPGIRRFSGNINVDMPVFNRATREIVGWGSEHSSLGDTLRTVATRQGFYVRPDPVPDETIFVRSDQYPFVRAGVPAVYIGTLPEASEESFRKTRYHKPSDDLQQPIDWASTGAYARLFEDLLSTVSGAESAPEWKAESFFKKTFAP